VAITSGHHNGNAHIGDKKPPPGGRSQLTPPREPQAGKVGSPDAAGSLGQRDRDGSAESAQRGSNVPTPQSQLAADGKGASVRRQPPERVKGNSTPQGVNSAGDGGRNPNDNNGSVPRNTHVSDKGENGVIFGTMSGHNSGLGMWADIHNKDGSDSDEFFDVI